MDKFKNKADAVFSIGEWLLFRGLLFFCLVDEGRRFIWWVLHQ